MRNIGQELSDRPGLDVRGTPPAPPYSSTRATGLQGNAYVELKQLIKQKGLLDRQPAYYTFKILLTFALLALSVTLFVLIDTLWIQLLNAVFLAFIFQQIAFIGHDSAHRQIASSVRNNNLIALVSWNLLLGVSKSWWMGRHHRHHARSNELDADPDAELGFLGFSAEGARRRQGFQRFLMKYQVFLVPSLALYPVALRLYTVQFLLWAKGGHVGKVPTLPPGRRRPPAEILLVAVHFLLYFGLSFYLLGVWQAVLFIVIHQGLFGLYYASVTASNHKGMPMWEEGNDFDFLRQQVLTSRDVKSHPLIDFWYGGLNFQIEHHLFPNMPRNKLREAQPIIRRFCEERSVAYSETSLVQSYREILESIQVASLAVRES